MTKPDTISFYTRQGCPLCDEAYEALKPLVAKHNLPIEVVDVDLDLQLLHQYNDRVPVIEYAGRVLAEGEIDPESFRKGLKELRPG